MRLKAILLILLGLVVVIGIVLLYGTFRWQADTQKLRGKLESARLPITTTKYDPRELEGLPIPVQHYFRAVLKEGQPIIASAKILHQGQFNMNETQEKWVPFTSNQLAIARPPGFDWNANIRMAPGINVFVHDAYVEGEGILYAKLYGLVPLADIRGTPEIAHGELMRFLAEAAWYPTALLPSQGVRWEAIDGNSARASLTDGATTVSLEFHFDAEGLISRARADARYRTVNGEQIATPWECRYWAYEVRNGISVPLEGEVAWLLPQGEAPYWRGRIKNIVYDLAYSLNLKNLNVID